MAKRSLFSRIAGAVRDLAKQIAGKPTPSPAPEKPKPTARRPITNEPIPKSIPKMTYGREPETEKVLVGTRYVTPVTSTALPPAPKPGRKNEGLVIVAENRPIPDSVKLTAEDLRDLAQNEKNVILTPNEQKTIIDAYFYKGNLRNYERSMQRWPLGFVTPEAAMNYASAIPDGYYDLLVGDDGRYYVAVTGG